jgi:phage-related protein
MTSPGGTEIGRLSIRILPDTSKFYQEAKAKLEKIAKRLKIAVAVEIDDATVRAELAKLRREAKDQTSKIKVEVDGDGAVREARRIRQFVQKMVGAIKMTVGINMLASIALIRSQMAIINKLVKGYSIRIPMEVVGISKWLAILTAVSGILLTMPHLIGAIGGAVAVVGGLFALLPGFAAAAAAGIASLVVGMKGFGAALAASGDPAKFSEALAKLTPNARAAAKELASFKPALAEIRKSVQEALFANMAQSFSKLKVLLPPVKSGLTGIASAQNLMIRNWIKMATSQESVKDTGTIMQNIKKGFDAAKDSLANVARALKDFAVVGSGFFPQMGKSANDMSKKFADWAREARESGRMQEWIQNAINKMKQLGRIVADITVGFRNIFQALRGGEDFLSIVERLSQGFRDWSEAKDTQSTLQSLARVMRVVIDAATELFGQVFRTAGDVFRELEPFLVTFVQTFATVFANALRAVTPMLKDMARFLSENKEVMVPLAITLVALITSFKLLASAIRGVIAIKDGILAVKAASQVIGGTTLKIVDSVKKIGSKLWESANNLATWASTMSAKWRKTASEAIVNAAKTSAAWTKAAIKSAAFSTKYYAIMVKDAIVSFGKMAATAIATAARMVAAWVAGLVRMAVVTVTQMAITAAAWVANWVRMAAVATANAVRMAAAWVVAMGPIAIVIAAIVALVAVVVLNWDKVKAVTIAVWNAVWGFIKKVATGISDTVTSAVNTVRDVWNAAWKFVTDIITSAMRGISNTVQSIKDTLSSIGNVVGKVVNFFQQIKDGIVRKVTDAINWLKGLPGKILTAIGDLGSLLYDIGKSIIEGFLRGLKAAWQAVVDFISGIGSWIADHKGPISYDRKLLIPAGKAIMEGLESGLDSGFARVQSKVSQMSIDIAKPFGGVGNSLASAIDSAIPASLASADKMVSMVGGQIDSEWRGQLTAEDMVPLEDRILAALASGLTVEIDGQKVTKSVNTNNIKNRRRG